jgi:hypothetical protein
MQINAKVWTVLCLRVFWEYVATFNSKGNYKLSCTKPSRSIRRVSVSNNTVSSIRVDELPR